MKVSCITEELGMIHVILALTLISVFSIVYVSYYWILQPVQKSDLARHANIFKFLPCLAVRCLVVCIAWRRRRRWHPVRIRVPGPGGSIQGRSRHWRDSGTLIGEAISRRWSRWWGSPDWASVSCHVGWWCQWAPLIWIKGPHSKAFSNQGWRGRGRRRNCSSVIIRTSSVFFIVIHHSIAISLAIAVIRINWAPRRRGRWRGRRVCRHAASVRMLRSHTWITGRIIASPRWRGWIRLHFRCCSGSAFRNLNVNALSW